MTSGLYGALYSGVTGLFVQSQAMGIISDNITNVNTVGYKRSHAQFATMVTQSVTQTSYSPGGVQTRPQLLVDQQGLLQSSASDTDLAINGRGFFVVNELSNPTSTEGEFMFTRAGSFVPDKDGNLRNSAGLFLQAWPIDSAGNIPTNQSDLAQLETVNISGLTGTAEPTSVVSLAANLQSSNPVNEPSSFAKRFVGLQSPCSRQVRPSSTASRRALRSTCRESFAVPSAPSRSPAALPSSRCSSCAHTSVRGAMGSTMRSSGPKNPSACVSRACNAAKATPSPDPAWRSASLFPASKSAVSGRPGSRV